MNRVGRRKFAFFGAIVVLMIVLVLMFAPGLSAGGPAIVESPAGPCLMFDKDKNIVSTNDSKLIITLNVDIEGEPDSQNTIAHLKCETQVDPPEKSIQFDRFNTGAGCSWEYNGLPYNTPEWQQVISSSGKSTLTCHFNGPFAP